MNKLYILCFLAISVTSPLLAQEKEITLEEIWGGAYRTEDLEVLRSMNNGGQYTVLKTDPNSGNTSVDVYDYETREKVKTLVSSSELPGVPGFSSYSLSDDETKILLATEVVPVFRRSTLGVFYVYDLAKEDLTRISEYRIQEPTLSPNGKLLAYVYENNLYLFNLDDKSTRQLTSDGKKNKIINGVTDWVYEEEFAFVRAFEWNANGTEIAFLRFDETEVPEFSMEVYGKNLYPGQNVFKYPKAGEKNAVVTLQVYDLATDHVTSIDLGEAYYIPRIKWMNDPYRLSVRSLNRHQNQLILQSVNTKDGTVSVLLEETDAAYVDITDDLTFLEDDSFIWTSEQDGYNHLYLYSPEGKLKNQITRGDWEVTKYYGYDKQTDRIYYQSTANGSINRDVYSVKINGKDTKRLTSGEGTHNADFSTDFSYFINTYSSATTPPVYTLRSAASGKELNVIEDNSELVEKLSGYELSPKEFSTLEINGNQLNMYLIKPRDFDPSKKYPLLMYQYSGPGSQNVTNSWMGTNDYWHQMLASEGYVIACVDGRGTGFKGRDFKKVTQKELGKYEVEDQIAAAKKLSTLPFIDEGKTGIWGWSYGGFMTTNCLLKGNDTFEMGIAVAPVTSWRFYDTIYTERYMQTPQENASGYDENSPLNYPELLEGDFLLVHGSGDDNVHVQNTMRMIEALVQANKQFDWAVYPDKSHSISGGNTRLHLYTKMTNFIREHLGNKEEISHKMNTKELIKG